MSKKVLIISTSLRKNSNSEALAKAFADGAFSAGNEVETVSLMGKNIAFCKGCLACQNLGHCVIGDDALEITEKMKNAEVIAFATPIYYYEMSGQMKTLLDRANSLFRVTVNSGTSISCQLPPMTRAELTNARFTGLRVG